MKKQLILYKTVDAAMEPSSKRRRTCHLHRLDDKLPGPRLADWLLQEFAWGNISAIAIQKVAQLALEDARSKRLQELDSLARTGCGGKRSNNVFRDLWNITKSMPKLPPACLMSLQRAPHHDALDLSWRASRAQHTASCCRTKCSHPFGRTTRTWSQIVCPSTADLKKFWAAAKQFSSHITRDQPGQLHQHAFGTFSCFDLFAPEC